MRLPKTVYGKTELQPFTHPSTFSVESNDAYWILHWTLEESEDYDRFAEDDGSGWIPCKSRT